MDRNKNIELLLSAVLHDSTLFQEAVIKVDGDAFVINEYNNFLADLRRYFKEVRCNCRFYITSKSRDVIRSWCKNTYRR